MPIAPFFGFAFGKEIASDELDKLLPGIVIGLIAAAIPDGISYRINMNERIGIAPYIKPLQYVDINDKGGNYASSAAGSLGVRFNIYTFDKKFRFSPFIEGQALYKKGNYTGISYGLSASYRIARKKLKVSTE